MATIKHHQIKITENMKNLKIYKPEYDILILQCAKLLHDYDNQEREFKKNGHKIAILQTNKSGNTNQVKNPHYLAIEKLRSDIIIYLRELGLTPQGYKKFKQDNNIIIKEESKLEKFLNDR